MNLVRSAVLGLIWFYQQVFSPHSTGSCRFVPSCSHYAGEAIHKHGVLKGIWLAARRLVRCNPFGSTGYDPVP
jgi:uncharacterized protein